MMFYWYLSVILSCMCANVISSPIIPCRITDAKCLEKSVPLLYTKLFQENAELGTENLDPMHHREIDGNLSILKFKLHNNTVEGFKNCNIENVKFNPATLVLQSDMMCPWLKMNGKYDLHGRLIILPVEGTGDYRITSKSYRIASEIDFKTVEKDGKKYIAVKTFRLKPEPLEPVVFAFENLFNGQKDLSDAVHKFANKNWREVANEIQDPVFNANFKKITKNMNKLLKSTPIEDLIQL